MAGAKYDALHRFGKFEAHGLSPGRRRRKAAARQSMPCSRTFLTGSLQNLRSDSAGRRCPTSKPKSMFWRVSEQL